MNEFPNRHNNHIVEELSERFFKNSIPPSWVTNHFRVDYGTDLNCEIDLHGGMSGVNFSVQLKGKIKDVGKSKVSINKIKRTTINRWLQRLEPTMLVVYIHSEKEAYWTWIKDNSFDLTKNNKLFSISISKESKLSQIDWIKIEQNLIKIFSNKHRLYEYPLIDKNNIDAWELYFHQEFELAIPLFKQLLSNDPLDALVLEATAICYYEMFSYSNAIRYINAAHSIASTKSTLLNKAAILIEYGKLNNNKDLIQEAIEIYNTSILSDVPTFDILYNLGSSYTSLNMFEEAVYYLDLAINLNPNKAEVWNNLGIAYMYLGERENTNILHKKSLICFDKALKLNPNLSQALFTKGSSLFKNFNQVNKGLELMLEATNKSEEYKFDNPNVFFWISEAYFTKLDFYEAKSWNSMGINHFPKDTFLLNQKIRLDTR